MATAETDLIDSQFIAENIGFLDNCFDNSFVLQSSLAIVKEHAAEQNETENLKVKKHYKKCNYSLNTTVLESTLINPQKSIVETTSNRRLKDWGLPPEITRKYEEKGITEMFEWQVTCLSNPKVIFECCNLVYSAPTSAGKTLVAEILTIKTILERQKKVIIILPFVSIVREKMFYLQNILSSSGIRVEGFMGSQSPPGGLQAVHVAICTIEKANSLVNKLLDEGSIAELGAIIVDELHLLGDPSRGYILELLLTKIKYVTSMSEDVQIQIVGMSATLPNLEALATWLGAELFITQFRPIPLDEYCLVGEKYYDKIGKCVSTLDTSLTTEGDSVLKICLDTIKDTCSILIFCMTKNWCENLAQSISSSFYKLGCEESEAGTILRSQLNSESISEVLEQLKNCPVGLDQILKKTISFGVAYHHAGLTFDERDIVESGFKSGAIRVLVATSTLSSGVNLPARKVIIRSPVFQRQPINILTYKQMIGRAGRMGKDSKGESILICTEAEKKIGFNLMMGSLDPVKSCIESEDKYMRAVLEMIASQVLTTKEQLDTYSKCTLLFHQQDITTTQNFLLENTLDELKNFELVRVQNEENEEHYIATPLGKACLSSSMAPNDGLSLFCELQKARQCLVLETDLHLIYLVTPYSVSSQWGNIDWLHLLTLWESLTKAMKRVGELVGVQESFIIRCLRGANKAGNVANKINIHKRFYTALALQDLVNEVPLAEVATKFQCARGFLQSLQQGAATFAGMVTAFCRQLGWKNMEMLISQFQDRLHFGIHSELLDLMKLPSLNGTRARTLFDSGFESISSIASADANTIENVLHKSIPFQSDKARDGEDSDDIRKRNKIKSVWITGYCGMTTKEAAENLIAEARQYLSHEIGVAEIKWDKNVASESCDSNNIVPDIVNITKENIKSVSNNTSIEHSKKSQSHETLTTNVTKHSTNKSKPDCSFKANSLNESKLVVVDEILEISGKASDSSDEQKVLSLFPNKSMVSQKSIPLKTSDSADNKNEVINMTNPSFSIKDDIIWDSLNFTETGLDNITKLRTSDKMFSPNISFGEFEDKLEVSANNISIQNETMSCSKHMSTKDISLFSSEGDNSSLFEESLPIDLIPSKLLDTEPTILCTLESTSDYGSLNSNTILNAFKSPLIENQEDDEDIKLVYDEDKTENHDTVQVVNTEVKIDNAPKRRKLTIKEAHPIVKKKKVENNYTSLIKTNLLDDITCIEPKIKSPLSKTFAMEHNKQKIKCFILKESDVTENLNIIEKIKAVSIYLSLKKYNFGTNEIIGRNLIGGVNPKTDERKEKPSYNEDIAIKGITLCINQETCIFLDISSLNDNQILKNRLRSWLKRDTNCMLLCSKTANVNIKRWLGVNFRTKYVYDISLIEWLIDSSEKIPDVDYLSKKYCGVDFANASIKIGSQNKRLKNLDSVEMYCVKAMFIGMVADKQRKLIADTCQPAQSIIDVESQVSKILANCEYYGLAVDKDLASRLLIDVRNSQETLEKKAYKLCGYHFNFNSSKDVAKVLGIYQGRKVSTKKSVLASHNSPLSSTVIYWRKLNSILTKTLYPLTEKACIYSEGDRINPAYTMFTCTGRISMHEPNLQNVPRTFSIPSEFLSLHNNGPSNEVMEFNCRNIFKAAKGYVLVSADYCQLEMRIMTHFSKDKVLTKIMNSDVDVFTSIAASWGNVAEDEVDDDLRQKAKQLCYGIIYGMGNKTLGQLLDVTEMEAAVFMDSFYKTYPSVKVFTQGVIEECRKRGYVETLTKRRRYLPNINSKIMATRSAAERQAVNTLIQGSAADIAKAAMCAIDNRTDTPAPDARLILQMHDELIYEVPHQRQHYFIKILKEVMENTIQLRVPLPVKVKCGPTWGAMDEIKY